MNREKDYIKAGSVLYIRQIKEKTKLQTFFRLFHQGGGKGGGGGRWAGVFKNVIDGKNETHPFHLPQN